MKNTICTRRLGIIIEALRFHASNTAYPTPPVGNRREDKISYSLRKAMRFVESGHW